MVPPPKSHGCMAKPRGAISTAPALDNAHLSWQNLFFQGQSTTAGSLLVITGLIRVGRGDILAAALNSVDFSNTYLVTPGQRIAFLHCRSHHPDREDKQHESRMKVSIGLKLVCSQGFGSGTGCWQPLCPSAPEESLGAASALIHPGARDHCHVHFTDFHITFSCTWMNLNPAENIPVVIAPSENPPQQAQPPEPEATAVPES